MNFHPSHVLAISVLCVVTSAQAQTTVPGWRTEVVTSPEGAKQVLRAVPIPVPTNAGPGARARVDGGAGAGGGRIAFTGGPASIRWTDTNHQFAVAQHLGLSADGQHVIAGWWLNSPRASTYTADSATPAWSAPVAAGFFVPVDASRTGQVLVGTGIGVNLLEWSPPSPTPVFSPPYPAGVSGSWCATSPAGNVIVGAGSTGSNTGAVMAFDATSFAPLWSTTLPNPPEGIDVSADGTVVAITTRPTTWVFNEADGSVRQGVPSNGDIQARPALSADGSTLVTGNLYGWVRTYDWDGSTYVLRFEYQVPPQNYYHFIDDVDVSADGQTVMAGVNLFVGATPTFAGQALLFRGSNPNPAWTDPGFADAVQSVSLSADGARGAAGSWGSSTGTPQGSLVAVYDTASPTPIFAVADGSMPGIGACFAVEISDDGTRIAAGGKAVAARVLGNGGYVMLIDSPRPGISCRTGGVGLGVGPATDVLFANGGTGDANRIVDLSTSQPLRVDVMTGPAGPAHAGFVLYGWTSPITDASVVSLPQGLGCLCQSGFVTGGSSAAIWNNLGGAGVLGAATLPSRAAPSILFNLPSGARRTITATIQGVIRDDGSSSVRRYSPTNALILRIR
ncbi:MAG: hypothetical protein HY292_03195 [Planctomycetes bacterium]|nr:hypothetical protein [Planctomycetota bacterium]